MLNNMIEIKMRNKRFEVKEGTSVYDILRDGNKNVLAVKVNNSIHSVYYELVENSRIDPITFYSCEGKRIYSRTLKFIFLKACRNLLLNMDKIEFTNKFQNNYFIRFKQSVNVQKIKEEMWKIIENDYKIIKYKVSYESAKKL